MENRPSVCPGCRLSLPVRDAAAYDGYFNTSPECWSVFGEVLAAEYGNPANFGRVHQLTVDSYAVQHAGGPHPDKSIGIHLCGLHLVLDRGLDPPSVPPLLQRLASRVRKWPHFPPPSDTGPLTVFDVALRASTGEHARLVRRWAEQIWEAWSAYHADVESLIAEHLDPG